MGWFGLSVQIRAINSDKARKMHYFCDSSVRFVLVSSCIRTYTAVLRAVLPCSPKNIAIFRRPARQVIMIETRDFIGKIRGLPVQKVHSNY